MIEQFVTKRSGETMNDETSTCNCGEITTLGSRYRMGRLIMETRSKVILMWKNGYPVTVIQERLSQGVTVSKVSLFTLIKKLEVLM